MNASTCFALAALLLAPHACLPATRQATSGDGFENDSTAGTWLARTNDLALFDRLVPDRIHPQAEGYRQVMLPELKATLCPPKLADTAGRSLLRSWNRWAGNCGCWPAGTTGRNWPPPGLLWAGEVRTPDTRWTSEIRTTPVAGEPGALDLAITFKLAEGMAKSAGVAVAFDFAGWSTNNYVLIPASVYNGNRNRIEYRGYCTGFDAEDFYKKDLPVTHGDVPRLELDPGKPSKIEVNASNATTPAMCFYHRQSRAGVYHFGRAGRAQRAG